MLGAVGLIWGVPMRLPTTGYVFGWGISGKLVSFQRLSLLRDWNEHDEGCKGGPVHPATDQLNGFKGFSIELQC